MDRVRLSSFLKNSFLLFLKRTSTQSKGFCPLGNDILESQSKTVSLLQPSVPQVPLFLQPRGCPSLPVEQLLHAILYILIEASKKDKLSVRAESRTLKTANFQCTSRLRSM